MKKIFKYIEKMFIETLNQTFTLLGFFVAWVLLEGNIRKVVGIAIIWSFIIWLLTITLREGESEDGKEDN
jgi:hypothetical protein